jgi:hypothetical protein
MQSAAHCVLDKTSAKASTTMSRPLDNTVPFEFIIAFLCQDAIEPAAKDLEQATDLTAWSRIKIRVCPRS